MLESGVDALDDPALIAQVRFNFQGLAIFFRFSSTGGGPGAYTRFQLNLSRV
jgi:hypothetical protein